MSFFTERDKVFKRGLGNNKFEVQKVDAVVCIVTKAVCMLCYSYHL